MGRDSSIKKIYVLSSRAGELLGWSLLLVHFPFFTSLHARLSDEHLLLGRNCWIIRDQSLTQLVTGTATVTRRPTQVVAIVICRRNYLNTIKIL